MIYVTLGTMHLDFARLVRAMDAIAANSGERVVLQAGMSETPAEHCERFDFKPRDAIAAIIAEARLVVTHAGIGSVIDVLNAERPLIVAPRLKRFGEHNNDHQLDLARAVERRGWGRVILDVNHLEAACAQPPPPHRGYRPARGDLLRTVRAAIDGAVARR